MTTKIQFAPTRRALLVSAAATFVLAGCGSLLSPSNPPSRIYVLEPPFGRIQGAAVDWGLAVTATDVPNVFDTDRVALSRDLAMDYFADTQWTDTNSRLLQSLLVEAYEKSGRITAVARDSGGVHGDYLLTSELRHFEAVYDNGDGAPEIHVEIEAKLLSLAHRDMIATHDAVQKVRASANNVPAVVAAFNQAAGAAISEIVGWSLDAPGAKYPNDAASTDAQPATVHHRRRRH
jgi:cholesterol transport system auxiliary component